ncbi:uncharacterized protein [Dermacentor andersoni]|uniref:uncharacterized protein isoform X1 n=2 Tax=Dermacentor andersoni TaxID=34620 RepID=UPI002415B02B|nr:cortactin-binding protein 2-like [Dermacentor andersoni]XP_054923657.1 cortactin-binding protein 2-like isoform X1 [Dermacentor andersoni]
MSACPTPNSLSVFVELKHTSKRGYSGFFFFFFQNYESSRDSSESASSTCSTRRRNRAMRSEWASTTTRPHQPPSETNRKEFEPTAHPAATTSGYAMPSVYYLRRRLLRHHSSQTEEDPCTETDSTQGSCGSPLQKYQPSPPQARRRTSSFAAADAVCREPRTSDLDSSLVSSSSGSGAVPPGVAVLRFGAPAHTDKAPSPIRGASAAPQCHSSEAGDGAAQCGGDTGYGETSSSEEQESSWSRSTESSAAPSSSSSPSRDTASGALASVSDDQDETQAEDDDEDDGEVDLSKLETRTQAAPFEWPPTTISHAPTGEGELEQESEPGTSGQMTSTEEQLQSLDTEDVSQMTAASEDPADDTLEQEPAEDQSEAEAQAMQPAEPPLPPAPQFLRPTIEIDRSDILHTAKPEIDEGDFGVGPSYTKMTEAEFVARLSIHEAARTGDLHVIKLLLKSDPKRMETVDERGWTPIHLAAANGHAEVVRFLAVEGADVAALDPTSYTAMHLAAMNGHNACLEVLLKVGADVDNITADGFTPLHLAALNNYADCVRTLLSWGANLAVEDALGRTVQDMVEEYALDDVSALLSGLWAHVDKYTQSRKQNGQSESSGRRRSTRKLVQMAAAAMGKR